MPQDKLEVAKQVVDAYNRRDVDALFAELVTPDFEWWPGGPPDRAALLEVMRRHGLTLAQPAS